MGNVCVPREQEPLSCPHFNPQNINKSAIKTDFGKKGNSISIFIKFVSFVRRRKITELVDNHRPLKGKRQLCQYQRRIMRYLQLNQPKDK